MNYIYYKNIEVKKIKYYLIIFYYLTLLVSFFFGEDLLGSAKKDFYQTTLTISQLFNENFLYTLLNYDEAGGRHSPVFFILLSGLLALEFNEVFLRFVFLNINLLTIIFFYRSLKLKFNNINKDILFILSLFLIISPTLRSYAIWPDSFNVGLMFFTISIYHFLKFKKKNSQKSVYLNVIYYAISAYFSPNFSVFSIYFLYQYCFSKKIKTQTKFIILFLNLFLAAPALYYIFFMGINFFHFNENVYGYEENIFSINNLSNKLIILPTLIFFYFFPILILNSIQDFNKNLNRNLVFLFFSILVVLTLSDSFAYHVPAEFLGGGGIFYKISILLFKNNIFLFIVSIISIFIILNFLLRTLDHILILILVFFSIPQLSIYHAYYDPLLFLLFFLIFDIMKREFFNFNKIWLFKSYLLIFYLLSLFKQNLSNLLMSI